MVARKSFFGIFFTATAIVAALSFTSLCCRAAETNSAASDLSSNQCPVLNFFDGWFDRVSRIQAEQPRWVTPLVTVTPRLEEEVRYDQMWQSVPGGHQIDNYDGMKGLELIPFQNVEVIIGVPAWETENTSPTKNGWSDESFLVKYRLLSANKDEGDYIVTAFMGLTVPDGGANYTARHFVYAPTIAAGKGWGDFDIQSTVGFTIPDYGASRNRPGETVPINTAFQYRVAKYFWPEFEVNYTWWATGTREGINQLYLTPGLLIGRLPIYGRLGLTFGAGVQIAASDNPTFHRNIVATARLPF